MQATLREIGLETQSLCATIVRWGRLIDTLILKLPRPMGQATPSLLPVLTPATPTPSTEATPRRGRVHRS